MKKTGNYLLAALFIMLLCGYAFAQQDYQIVQNFKAKQEQIKDAVKSAQSLDDLNNLQAMIDQLRTDYEGNKDLLDKSLYPDDFNSSINKLDNDLNTRKGDFAQITTLKDQVSQIQVQLDSLNARNADLLSQIEQIKETNGKDAARLAKTIAELKSSLAKRDKIIMSMLAGLLPSSNTGSGSLTNNEKQQLYSETKKAGIVANIKKAINDNVQFLTAVTLTPEDLNTMKKQQAEFENVWNNVGPSIVSVYSAKKENTKNISGIDSSLSAWNSSMDQVAWNSIHQKFSDKGISLSFFTNGDEFVQTISSYIDDEIKNADVNGKDSKNMYAVFVDSVWAPSMRQAWIPYLMNNKMLAGYDNAKIESKIDAWRNSITPNNFIWLYVVGVLLLVILGFSLIRMLIHSRKNKVQQDVAGAKIH